MTMALPLLVSAPRAPSPRARCPHSDGKGVDRLEFVVGMLQLIGCEVCGQPLDWTDVRPFVLKFEELDVSHTGTISLDDLSKFAEQQRRRRVRQRLEQAKAHITLVKEVAALKRMSFSSAARTTSRRKRNRLQAWRLNEGWAKKQPTRPRPDSGPRALAGRPEAAEGSWA